VVDKVRSSEKGRRKDGLGRNQCKTKFFPLHGLRGGTHSSGLVGVTWGLWNFT